MGDFNLNNLTDEQIVLLVFGDSSKYALLMDRYSAPLLIFICNRFHFSKAEAEDIVQETFVKAFFGLSTFNTGKKWRSWLYQIAINNCRSYLRSPRSDSIEMHLNLCIEEDLENCFDSQISRENLIKKFSQLRQSSREVLDLHYIAGYGTSTIAKRCATTERKIKSRIRNALLELRSKMLMDLRL